MLQHPARVEEELHLFGLNTCQDAGPPATAAGIRCVLPAEVWSSAPCLRPARQPHSLHLLPLPRSSLLSSAPLTQAGARGCARNPTVRAAAPLLMRGGLLRAQKHPNELFHKNSIFHGIQADGQQLDKFEL